MDLNKTIAIVAFLLILLGFFLALYMVHRTPSKAKLEQLVCNRYGELDPVLCAFWLGNGTLAWGLIWCTLKGLVPEGIGAIYGSYATTVVGPLMLKIVFKAKSPPETPPEKQA